HVDINKFLALVITRCARSRSEASLFWTPKRCFAPAQHNLLATFWHLSLPLAPPYARRTHWPASPRSDAVSPWFIVLHCVSARSSWGGPEMAAAQDRAAALRQPGRDILSYPREGTGPVTADVVKA